MEKEGVPNNAGYYWDEVHMIAQEMRRRMKEDIDKYATEEEKEILKESLADTRAMNFIKKSGGDIEAWKDMIKKMSEREVKEAAFEFQSAIDGINHQFKHWMVPRKMAQRFGFSDEHWAYREGMESRRKMYRKYLNILKQFNMRESKEITEAANPKGKTRKVDDPYETYYGAGDWEWRVLKHYQTADKERQNPYARVFCAVKSPFTFGSWEYGDTYCKDIPGYEYE
jgi:hypothetical protein